jgi:hypothetical protein
MKPQIFVEGCGADVVLRRVKRLPIQEFKEEGRKEQKKGWLGRPYSLGLGLIIAISISRIG